MQFMDVALGKPAVAPYKLKKTFQYVRMILNNCRNDLRRLLAWLVRNQIGIDTSLDQRFSDSPIEIVDALDLPGFNRPFAAETFVEFRESTALLEISALIFPELEQRPEFSVSERTPVLGQVGDWFPDEDHRVCFTRMGANAHLFFLVRRYFSDVPLKARLCCSFSFPGTCPCSQCSLRDRAGLFPSAPGGAGI